MKENSKNPSKPSIIEVLIKVAKSKITRFAKTEIEELMIQFFTAVPGHLDDILFGPNLSHVFLKRTSRSEYYPLGDRAPTGSGQF